MKIWLVITAATLSLAVLVGLRTGLSGSPTSESITPGTTVSMPLPDRDVEVTASGVITSTEGAELISARAGSFVAAVSTLADQRAVLVLSQGTDFRAIPLAPVPPGSATVRLAVSSKGEVTAGIDSTSVRVRGAASDAQTVTISVGNWADSAQMGLHKSAGNGAGTTWILIVLSCAGIIAVRIMRFRDWRHDVLITGLLAVVLASSALATSAASRHAVDGDVTWQVTQDQPPIQPILLTTPPDARLVDLALQAQVSPAATDTVVLGAGALSVKQVAGRMIASAPPWGDAIDIGKVPDRSYSLRMVLEDGRSIRIWLDGKLTRVQMRYDLRSFLPVKGVQVSVNPTLTESVTLTAAAATGQSNTPQLASVSLTLSLIIALLLGLRVAALLSVTSAPDPERARFGRIIGRTVLTAWVLAALVFVLRLQPGPERVPFVPGFNQPFGPRAPRFSDFYQTIYLSRSSDPYELARSIYPPGAWLALRPMTILGDKAAFVLFFGLLLGFVIGLFWRYASVSGARNWVFLASVTSLPLLFAIERGNTELLPFAMCLAAATLVVAVKPRAGIAGAMIGVAAAIKIWPLFLLVPLHRRFGWSSTRPALLSAAAFTIAPGLLMGKTPWLAIIEWLGVLGGEPVLASQATAACGTANNFGAYGTSVSTLVLSITSLVGCRTNAVPPQEVSSIVGLVTGLAVPIALLLLSMVVVLLYRWRTNLALSLAAAFVAIAVLPYPSFAYRNLYIVGAVVLLCVKLRPTHPLRLGLALAVAIAPANVLAFRPESGSLITSAALITPIAGMVALIMLLAESKRPSQRAVHAQRKPNARSRRSTQDSADSLDPAEYSRDGAFMATTNNPPPSTT